MVNPIAGGNGNSTPSNAQSDEFNSLVKKADGAYQSIHRPGDNNPNDMQPMHRFDDIAGILHGDDGTPKSDSLENLWSVLDRLSRGKALNPSGAPQISGEYDGEGKASMALKAGRSLSGLQRALQFATTDAEKKDILAQIDEVNTALKDAGIKLSDYLDFTPQYGYTMKPQFGGAQPDMAKG
jgi:hypothetical protein